MVSPTILTLVAVFAYFLFIVPGVNPMQAQVGLVIVAVISFLFATVAARAIAIVGMNPVPGMTLPTLIISSFILELVGVEDSTGLVAALLIGYVVCTALSMSGGFISDLKTVKTLRVRYSFASSLSRFQALWSPFQARKRATIRSTSPRASLMS